MAVAYDTASAASFRAPARASTRPVEIWLWSVLALLAIMIVVGGLTRLTDSGLSIVEWRPVTGTIPPLSEAQWLVELEKYRSTTEYQVMNRGMSLDEFKVIYLWEWGHRFLGRLIGLAFFVPFAWFLWTKRVQGPLAWRLGGIFVLGGLQGALGWYMVQSGLTGRLDVSQYRLAAHLGLAFVIFAAIFWTILDLRRGAAAARRPDIGAYRQPSPRWSICRSWPGPSSPAPTLASSTTRGRTCPGGSHRTGCSSSSRGGSITSRTTT